MPLPLPSPLAPVPPSGSGQHQPLFPTPAPSKHKPRMSDSSDFGSFHDAGPLSSWEPVEGDDDHPLGEHDLLGSFDELSVAGEPSPSQASTPNALSSGFTEQAQARTAQRQTDLLGEIDDLLHHEEEIANNGASKNTHTRPESHWSPFPFHQSQGLRQNGEHSAAVAVPHQSSSSHTASRPVPPLRSPPRRLSQVLSSGPPLSPPLISAGAPDEDLLWQSPSHPGSTEATRPSFGEADDSMRWRQASFSDESALSTSPLAGSSSKSQTLPNPASHSRSSSRTSHSARETPPSHASGLLNTLVTTSKIASKWKTVLGPSTFSPPVPGSTDIMDNAPTPTAMPTNITHSTPFSHQSSSYPQSYIPPSGAPGFRGDNEEKRAMEWIERERNNVADLEWRGTKLLGRRPETRKVLEEAAADAIRPHLPPRQRLASKWNLLFSLDQHGASLATMYRLIDAYADTAPNAGNILIVKDAADRRFGVYLNQGIKKVEGSYYGSGESFLYKITDSSESGTQAKVFKWTGKNQYFALCESGFISFGGGGGTFGLILDSTFSSCSSARSPAYDNEVLCVDGTTSIDKTVRFECIGLEVWGT